jgi:purine-nucleoside phosphorylase
VLLVAAERIEPKQHALGVRTAGPLARLSAAVEAIRQQWSGTPQCAIVLGTGLGGLAELIESEAIIPFRQIPGFPHSTALAHKGQLVCGTLAGTPVVALQGRCHLYEGYCFEQLTFATCVSAALGAKQLVVSNAAGGVNPHFAVGDVMLIDDHVNFMFQSLPPGIGESGALRGCSDRLGVLPATRHYYCRQWIDEALALARRENIALQRGVYIGVTGPNYETRAEYRMFRKLGDAVGMSTIPEVLAAAACGMRVLGFSAITNVARPDAPQHVDAQEVADVAACAAPKLERLLLRLLSKMA